MYFLCLNSCKQCSWKTIISKWTFQLCVSSFEIVGWYFLTFSLLLFLVFLLAGWLACVVVCLHVCACTLNHAYSMNHYNINANLIRVIQNLYDKASSAACLNGDIRDWFRTTIGVRQGCLLSPILFNVFLENIMTDALDDHQGTVSIGGRTITNLCFADNIDGLAGTRQELDNLVRRLDSSSTAYGMVISASKTKLMTNSNRGIPSDIFANVEKLETVENFKYLGAIISDEGSKPEVLSRIAVTTATLAKLKTIWKGKMWINSFTISTSLCGT